MVNSDDPKKRAGSVAGRAGRVGRPPIEDWRLRSWAQRFNHAEFSFDECWTPKDGDLRAYKMKLPYADRELGYERNVRVARWLYLVVMVDEGLREPIGHDQILEAGSECVSRLCVNPHHADVVDRIEAGRRRGALFKDRWEQEVLDERSGVASLAQERKAKAAEEHFDRYCVVRLMSMLLVDPDVRDRVEHTFPLTDLEPLLDDMYIERGYQATHDAIALHLRDAHRSAQALQRAFDIFERGEWSGHPDASVPPNITRTIDSLPGVRVAIEDKINPPRDLTLLELAGLARGEL